MDENILLALLIYEETIGKLEIAVFCCVTSYSANTDSNVSDESTNSVYQMLVLIYYTWVSCLRRR
jgi:hypothetical protein